ncbi:MAG: spore germination protein, partial [Firmicutes bacterium]|nr:spore germination protein [Bacillota bacterium]
MRPGGGLSPRLGENLLALKRVFGNSADIVYRTFTIDGLGLQAALVYIDGLVDTATVNDFVLRPLMHRGELLRQAVAQPAAEQLPVEEGGAAHPLLRHLQQQILVNTVVKERTVFSHLVDDILSGAAALLIDTVPAALFV